LGKHIQSVAIRTYKLSVRRRGELVKLSSFIKAGGWYTFRVLLAVDQLGNALLGGRPDHTISGRVGYHAKKGNPFFIICEIVIDNIFFWDTAHCRSSIEWDEVEKPLRGSGRK
jgi:hypothetical protein